MFFAPALIVAAASAVSAAPLAMPAQQAVQQNLGLDLEDKDAFFLFDMIKGLFGKRDLESMDHHEIARALADMDEEKQAAFKDIFMKWGVPVIGGLISGLPDLIHGKKDNKRDLELEDKDAFFLFDMIKKVFGKRDLEVEDKDAFFLFDMIKKVFGKRGLEGEVDLANMDDDEKKAFWGAVAKWGVPVLGGIISGLPDLIHGKKNKRDLELEDKDAFFLFDMIKKVFGKRDLEVEDKDAFFLFDMIKKVFGKRGLEGEVDLENMNDDEKKAFWGAVAKWGVPIISGLFSGMGSGSKDKRDLDHEVFARAIQELDLEDKDAFFLFDMIKKVFGKRDIEDEDKDAFFLFDIIKKVFGKRDLQGEVDIEDKDAFFLFDMIKKVFGKRDLNGEVDLEDKDAFFLFDMIKKVFGKRDLETLEDKDAFFLFDMIKKVFGKRGLEGEVDVDNMSDDEKKAFWGAVAKWGVPIISGLFSGMGSGSKDKRDLYDLPTVPSVARRALESDFARRSVQDQGLLDALNDF
jgi:hypothetical protein